MKENKTYLAIISMIIALFLLREGCNTREANRLVKQITDYKTDAENYKTKLGLQISTNNALALETQEQVRTLLATNDTLKDWIKNFKDIKAGIVLRETTIVKEVAVPFERPIPCDFKPFPVKKISKDFEFYTTVANTGLTIDSLKIPNEAKIVVGDKKQGFLGTRHSLVVEVNNSNPYIQTSNISGYVYEPKKNWYEKMWVNLALGAGIGYIGSQLINK